MVEVAVINSFHNHDPLFYPIKTLKSIPGLSLKIAVFPGINREFNPVSPIILLYYLRNFSVTTVFKSIIIRSNSKFSSMRPGANSYRFNRCAFLKCERCINTNESAAVFGFHRQIVVGEYLSLETAAAGLLFLFGQLLIIK
jgi:hypothetical protein